MDIYNNKVETGKGLIMDLPTGLQVIMPNTLSKDDYQLEEHSQYLKKAFGLFQIKTKNISRIMMGSDYKGRQLLND